jgi:tetratricopeptide (TPR) repeat protein
LEEALYRGSAATKTVGILWLGLSALGASTAFAQQPAEAEQPPPDGHQTSQEAMQNGGMTEERDVGEDGEARAHFRAGRSLYDAGRFHQAAEEFEEAYRLSQRPELMFNAYVAYRDANDLEAAIRSLGVYLDEVEDVPDRVNLQARLASMSEALEEQREREAEAARPDAPVSPPNNDGPIAAGIAIASLGGVAAIVGVITGVIALGDADALVTECPDAMCPPNVDLDERRSSVETLGIATDVLLFAGGALAVTGIIIAIVAAQNSPRAAEAPPGTEVSAMCTSTGCFGTLRTRF